VLIKKAILLIVTILGSILLGAAIGTIIQEWKYPQQWTVQSNVTLETYLNEVLWTNGTLIDWGNVNASESYYMNLTVVNVGNVDCTVYFIVENLPLGHTLIWTGNQTLLTPLNQISGDVTLTILADAEGAYGCNSYIRGVQS